MFDEQFVKDSERFWDAFEKGICYAEGQARILKRHYVPPEPEYITMHDSPEAWASLLESDEVYSRAVDYRMAA